MNESSDNSSDAEFIDSKSESEFKSETESQSISDISLDEHSSDSDIHSNLKYRENLQSNFMSMMKSKSKNKTSFNSKKSSKSHSPQPSSYTIHESYSDSMMDLESSNESYSETESTNNQAEIERIIGINQSTFSEQPSTLKFYVKYKNLSYIHCSWVTKNELCHDQRGFYLYKNFIKNRTPFRQVNFFNQIESFTNDKNQLYKPATVEFDKGYITPEKVISIQSDRGQDEFLIKWISLDYDQSTWEDDAPANLIEEYIESNSNTHSPIYDHEMNKDEGKFVPIKESPIYKNDHTLTDYQVEGLNWLLICWFVERNSILADEMGLGKTIESIAALDYLSKTYPSNWGPFLVVCPLSTMSNWLDEFDQWTDFRVVSLLGNPLSRKIIKDNMIFRHIDDKDLSDLDSIIFDVLIVTYESLVRELSFIKKFKFMYTIIDEAQRIKNAKSAIYKHCTSIQTKQCLLMTGTPIQNDIYEIWSLLHFIEPESFPDFNQFSQAFGSREPHVIERLQEVLHPFLFRRKKSDINLELPEKEETIIEVEMTHIQRTFSQLLIKDNLDILSDLSTYKTNLKNIMMELRKLFCHPFLIPKLESLCLSEYRDSNHIPPNAPLSEEDEINSLISASGKTILIDKLLPKLKEGNHKVLIFSQMTRMLDIIEDYLVFRHYTYERIDGQCSNAKRALSIENFQNDDNIFVFLLSTRAGGLGINLTSADTVILYDCDWNPQNDIQAQSRCHRIGQSNKVNVYRLITRGCYESEMFSRASQKLALDFAILDSDPSLLNLVNESESESQKNSRLELQMILRKGAYYTFNDDPNEIDKFCSENIDQILEHRSHTRKDMVSGGKSRFSKVSFDVAAAGDNEIIKSNFWESLVAGNKKSELDDQVDLSLDSGIKTRKKNIKFTTQHDEPKSKKSKKTKKQDSDSLSDSDNDDENSNSSESDESSSSSYSYDTASDQEFVLPENKEGEDEEEEDFNPDPDDDDLFLRNKASPKPLKPSSSSPRPFDSLINQMARPVTVSAPSLALSKNPIYKNIPSQILLQTLSSIPSAARLLQLNQGFVSNIPGQPINPQLNAAIIQNQQLINQQINNANFQPYLKIQPTANNQQMNSVIIQPNTNSQLKSTTTPLKTGTLHIISSNQVNQNPVQQAPKPTLNINNSTSQQPSPKDKNLPKKGTNSPSQDIIEVSDSSDDVFNSPIQPPNEDSTPISSTSSNANLASEKSAKPSDKDQISIDPIRNSSLGPDIKMAESALRVINNYGIGGSRLFLDKFMQELAKSLVFIAYCQLSSEIKEKYAFYINEFIPNGNQLILKIPFCEFKDANLIKILFKGEELEIIQNSYKWDFFYKVALYVSNEVLPKNFEFAPELDTPSGWTPIEDFIALTSVPFEEKIEDIINNEKLPFKQMTKHFGKLDAWLSTRIKLITYEISLFMPKDYSIYELNSDKSKLIHKQFKNVEMFKALNPHVIQPKKLNINLQKKLLRIFYFYGIPNKNGIRKVKDILRCRFVDEKLILIFTIKFLKKAIKYEKDLTELYLSLPKIDNSFIESNEFVDIEWINERAIQSVASNLILIYQVRENFKWLNYSEKGSDKKIKLIGLPEWKKIKSVLYWWDLHCDLIIFNLTAYYGFLFNSMFCSFVEDFKLNKEAIDLWKEKEILSLSPIIISDAKALAPIFNIEMKKERITQMIHLIKIARSKENPA